jgi:hypothetical protein
MRDIPFEEWFHVDGLRARALLRSVLTPSSLDDFEAVWDQYPHDIIEFSAFDIKVGTLPHRNHVIWEVRGY